MRILHISTVTSGGGATRVARALHDRQRRRGFQSTLLCGRGAPREEEGVETLGIARWRHLGNVLLQRLSGHEGALNTRAWKGAFERFVDRADVVHLHNAHGYYLPRPVLELLLSRPAIWTLHDEWLLTGRCAFPLSCTGYRRGCRPCPYLGRYPSAWIDRAGEEFPHRRSLAALTDAIFVTPSAMTRDRFVAAGFPADRFRVIPNPLDLETRVSASARHEARCELRLPEDRSVLLFVAAETWIPRKGIGVFAAATRLLSSPQAWQLCVVGDLSSSVRRLFADHPVPTRLVGGVTERRLLAKYYLASDVLVVPSRDESFGLTVLEAAATGCRVVCSDLPVFREILADCGTYFAPGDHHAAARALEDLGGGRRPDPLLAEARALRREYSLDRITDRYLAAYRSALGG